MDKKEIANRIKMLRLDDFKGNMVNCAKFLEMEYNTYRDYEGGRSGKTNVYLNICEKYDINSDWLLEGKGPKYKLPPDIQPAPELLGKQLRMAPIFESNCSFFKSTSDMEFPPGHSGEYKATDSSDQNAFWIKVSGDSMIGFDIKEGDYLLVEPNAQIENGNIVVAVHPEEGNTVKKYMRYGDRAVLKPGNPDYPDIPLENGGDRFRMYRIAETRRRR